MQIKSEKHLRKYWLEQYEKAREKYLNKIKGRNRTEEENKVKSFFAYMTFIFNKEIEFLCNDIQLFRTTIEVDKYIVVNIDELMESAWENYLNFE